MLSVASVQVVTKQRFLKCSQSNEVPRRRPRQLVGEWLRHLRVLVVENLME